MTKSIPLVIFAALLASSSQAGIIRVDPNGGGDATTISAGFLLTTDGDTPRESR
jgi:hypothetical protein